MDNKLTSPARAMQILYEIDGHLYTTFVVAMLAGMPVARAAELSWGSQIPDENRRLTAVSAAWNSLWNHHSRSIMQTLHSLHGGDAQAIHERRDDLKVLVSIGIAQGEPDWKVGLMIHAFADSYAHTHVEHGTEEAYGIPWGHGGDGHTPDQIGNFPQKYLAYASNLYQALAGGRDPGAALARLRGIVEAGGEISAAIAAYAAELGMNEDLSDRTRERLLAQISESDVSRTMQNMERQFARP
jgi:hypothetical protein